MEYKHGEMRKLYELIHAACLEAEEDCLEIGGTVLDRVQLMQDRVRILTRSTRDSRYSRNGGDYDYWTDFISTPTGVIIHRDWSCDFTELQDFDDKAYADVTTDYIYNVATVIVGSRQSALHSDSPYNPSRAIADLRRLFDNED